MMLQRRGLAYVFGAFSVFFVWWDGQNVVFLQMQLVLHSLITERRGAKMGMQCKSATIPVAVSSFFGTANSVTG